MWYIYVHICIYVYLFYIYIHTHKHWNISHKKEWNLAICDKIDESVDYAKSNKSDRERQILYVFTYMWNLNKKTNKYNERETDSQTLRTN